MKDTTTVWTKWTCSSVVGLKRLQDSLEKMQANGRISDLTTRIIKQFDGSYRILLVVFDYAVEQGRGGKPSDIVDTVEDIKWGAYRPRAAGPTSGGLRARITCEIIGSEINGA